MTTSERLQEQAIERFWETVPPLWGTIRSHIRTAATEKFDITVEQFHVLRYVRCGRDTISELATAKNISRPAISQAVDVLVKKGMLRRVQSQQDRRYVELTLTDSGSDLLDAIFKETRGWMKEGMQILNEEELEVITKGMEALQKILK